MRRLLMVLVVLAIVGTGGYVWRQNSHKSRPNQNSQNNTQLGASNNQSVGFDKTQYSTTDPTSIWVVVNKKRPIPESYVPADLVVPSVKLRLAANAEQMHIRAEAGKAMEEMFAAAQTPGYSLMLGSGYRSAAYQKTLYNSYVANDGQASADKYSARPGYSEHQTGWAFDAETADMRCHLQACFGDLVEGKWLAENAYKYGFILRYLADKVPVTGYEFEPWHFRYVGKDLAIEMHKQNITTLEEFFDLPAAPNY